MVRTQIQLTEEQAARLRRLAAARGVSMAAVIRDAVDSATSDHDDEARWERALSAVGCGSSGRRDIAVEHDRHLAEALSADLR